MDADKIKASPQVIAADLGDGAALFDIRSGVYYDLNDTGGIIWALLEEPRSVQDLATELAHRCDIEPDVALADTSALVNDLLSHDLVIRSVNE